MAEGRGVGPAENDSAQRIRILENVYDALEFSSRNNKVHLIFSFVYTRYWGKSAVPSSLGEVAVKNKSLQIRLTLDHCCLANL